VKDKAIEKFNSEQLILAQSASQGIKAFFSEYQSGLKFLSQFPSMRKFDSHGEDLMIRFYTSHSDQIEAITRVDSKGKIVFTYPYNESAIGRDISYQEHIRKIIETKKPVISDVFMAVQGYLAIAYHVPVLDDNEYKGSLAILIAIDKLGKRYLQSVKIGETGYAWLLSENNIEIFCPIPGHTGKSYLDNTKGEVSITNLIEKIKKSKEGTAVSYHGELNLTEQNELEEKFIVFYRVPLSNTYWTIIISVPEKEIYSTLISFRNRLILIFVILFVVMTFYFYSFTKVRTVLKEEEKRKSTEKALRQSERQFRLLFENSPIGICVADLNGKLLAYNKAMLKQGNYTNEDIKKIEHIAELYYDQKQSELILDKFQKHGTVKSHPVLFKRKGDAPYYALISLNKAIFKGEPCLHAIIEDITERRKAEIALQENELRLRNIIEHSTNIFYSHDTNHVVHYFSPQVKEILGYEVEEALIKWTELASDNPINEIGYQKTVKAIETGIEQEPYEFELIHKDGHKVWVEVREAPVIEDGKTIAIVGSLTDITERKRIENVLIESEKKFRQVVEEAVEVIFTTDTKGYFTYANPAALKITGYSIEELKKFRYLDLIEQEYTKKVEVHHLKQLRTRAETTNFEYPFRTKAGELKWFNQNSRLIIEEDNVKGFYLIARDVTERYLLESARQEAERRLSTLMSNLPGIAYRCRNDKDWTMEFVSHGCRDLTGYEPSDLINNSVISYNDLILEEDQQPLWNKWQDVLSRREVFQEEYRIRTKDGKIKWVWEKGCGVFSSNQVVALVKASLLI
jgi:PAS domain S-box-containing protein